MNTFKTSLFKISFEKEENESPCVILERIEGGAYTEFFNLTSLCEDVMDLFYSDKLTQEEAIRIIHKGSTFFVTSHTVQ